ncbi:RNA polymerase sigma factor [Saccharothrix syringae]|uniref:Sigma-70 family RNA polymerase sigma factor n=1 Tax=Saccharothrix syringae TaxID=103733 RepID=A0A5Q0H421_SACSY|nr:sigma-70 family RNA polymerase sigma factor [Saccharothrix syringae]QFZ20869.1 sigma-70 family RNA polymerase sigma factor [Saccharothrix syringae]
MSGTPEQARQDDELVNAARAGSNTAYARLFVLHHRAAMTVARHVARVPADAEDLVADAFTRVLAVLRRGGGPTDGRFRAYLFTAVRNTARDHARHHDRIGSAAEAHQAVAAPVEDTAGPAVERMLVAAAFARLPARWQVVLWHTEVRDRTPTQVAPLLGLTANGASALARRARRGLRRAYLDQAAGAAARRPGPRGVPGFRTEPPARDDRAPPAAGHAPRYVASRPPRRPRRRHRATPSRGWSGRRGSELAVDLDLGAAPVHAGAAVDARPGAGRSTPVGGSSQGWAGGAAPAGPTAVGVAPTAAGVAPTAAGVAPTAAGVRASGAGTRRRERVMGSLPEGQRRCGRQPAKPPAHRAS